MFGKTSRETSKILSKEHENILKVVSALEKESDLVEKGKNIDENFFRKVIDFIRNYADKFHHAKEENILFKEFNKCAEKNPECLHCNPTEQMLIEHDKGRKFVKGMEKSLNKKDKKELVKNARRYSHLIQEHIFKEDNILYPMTEEVLNESKEKEILKRFIEVAKKSKNNEEKHLKFVRSLK